MVSKIFLALALCVCLANADGNQGKVRALEVDETKRSVEYDCSGREDGNYIHPSDCTKFMSCVAQQHAYERDCAACHVDENECPTGRLHYHHPADACLWFSEAGCVIDPQDPVPCNPDDCWVDGYCHDYHWCERDESDHKGKGKSGTRKYDTCDPAYNLYFNPNHNSIHGGVCDFWENLDQDTKDLYNRDPTCIDPHCEWKADPTKDCSATYWYFHPEKNDGQDQELHCPSLPDGEQLVWDQARKSCHTCDSVSDSNGNACC